MGSIPRVVIRLAIDKKDGGTVRMDFDAPPPEPNKPEKALTWGANDPQNARIAYDQVHGALPNPHDPGEPYYTPVTINGATRHFVARIDKGTRSRPGTTHLEEIANLQDGPILRRMHFAKSGGVLILKKRPGLAPAGHPSEFLNVDRMAPQEYRKRFEQHQALLPAGHPHKSIPWERGEVRKALERPVVLRLAIDKRDGGTVGMDFDAPVPSSLPAVAKPTPAPASTQAGPMVVNDRNGMPDYLRSIPGNAMAKRAMEISAAGNHPLTIVAPKGVPHTELLHKAYRQIGGDPAFLHVVEHDAAPFPDLVPRRPNEGPYTGPAYSMPSPQSVRRNLSGDDAAKMARSHMATTMYLSPVELHGHHGESAAAVRSRVIAAQQNQKTKLKYEHTDGAWKLREAAHSIYGTQPVATASAVAKTIAHHRHMNANSTLQAGDWGISPADMAEALQYLSAPARTVPHESGEVTDLRKSLEARGLSPERAAAAALRAVGRDDSERWPRTPSAVQGKPIYVFARHASTGETRPVAGPFHTHQEAAAATPHAWARLRNDYTGAEFHHPSFGTPKEGHTIEPLYPDLKSTGESPFRKALTLRLAIDRNDKGATRSIDFDAPQGGSAPAPKPPARNLTLGEDWSRRDDHHRAFSNYSPEKVDRHRDQLLTARAHETDPSTPDFLRMQARSAQGASMTPGSGAIFPAFYGETRKWFERHHVGHQQVKREGDAMPHEEFLVETKHGNVLGRFPTGPRLQGEVQFHPHGSMADFPRVRKVRKAACASGARLGLAVPDGFEPLRKSLRARGLTDQQATAAALRAIQRGRR